MTKWVTKKLGDESVAKIIMGQSPSSTSYNEEFEGLPFLQGCAEFGKINPNTHVYCKEPLKVAPENSILMSVRAPVGTMNRADQKYIIGRGLCAIVPVIDGDYLYYYLSQNTHLLEQRAQGSTFLAVNTTEVSDMPITYPESLAEQRRIAGILSSADGAIAASEALIAKYRNIKRGLLTTLLQPKEGWKKVKLGECCEPSSEKYNPLIQTEFKDCIEMENMEQGSGTINGTSDISKLLSIKNTFRKRDVLYGKLRPYLRKYWLAQFDGVCSTEIWVLRHSEFIDAQFLFYLFQTELINKIANLSSGTKMPRADWSLMQNQELFIPDLAEQRRIAEILSSVDAKIAAEEKVVEKYKGVKKGLMEEMMKEIKVNN